MTAIHWQLTKEASTEDVPALSDGAWSEVQEKIDAVCDTGFSHPDLKLVQDSRLDTPLWQITVKEDNTDHRIFLDIQNDTFVVLAIWHADFTHDSQQHWTALDARQTTK